MEPELIILKPAELFLKSEPVMRSMMKVLAHNVKVALKENDVIYDRIVKERLRISIYSPETDEVISAVKNVFGISVIIPAIEVGIKALPNTALELAKEAGLTKRKSFAVRVKRADKSIKSTSKELEIDLGKFIQDSIKSKVNLKKPDVQINIEIYKGKGYVSLSSVRGLGGLPEGVSGKVVCLAKGLSAWMMRRRGCEIIPFEGSIKSAEKFAEENRAKALVLGDTKVSKITSKFPIFTPLVGLDKRSLSNFSQKIRIK